MQQFVQNQYFLYDLGTDCGSFLLVGKTVVLRQEIQRKAGKSYVM